LKGIKFFKEDDFNNALECFVSARRLDEENFDYQRMIARCLMKKPRRVYEAKDICMELIKKDTFNPDNYFLLGEIYREANINNTALHYYEKALKLGGNEAKIRKAMSLLKPQKKKYSFFNKFLAK
jgi:cytochrome c-type biogenesis protein CcmH/NrfG